MILYTKKYLVEKKKYLLKISLFQEITKKIKVLTDTLTKISENIFMRFRTFQAYLIFPNQQWVLWIRIFLFI